MSERAKPIEFRGGSLAELRSFPADVRRAVGFQLYRVQAGLDPLDWKPMNTVGPGVREIRTRGDDGAFRVMYITRFENAIYVLHCFQKKTQKTDLPSLALTAQRYKDLIRELQK